VGGDLHDDRDRPSGGRRGRDRARPPRPHGGGRLGAARRRRPGAGAQPDAHRALQLDAEAGEPGRPVLRSSAPSSTTWRRPPRRCPPPPTWSGRATGCSPSTSARCRSWRTGPTSSQIERALLDHMAEAASALPAAADLERARNRMLTEHFSSMQKLENRADQFSQFTTFFDDPAGVAAEAERYEEVSAEDLRDVAARYCTPSERVVVWVVPKVSDVSDVSTVSNTAEGARP